MPAAPSNLMSFPGDEEMLLIWQGPGGGGGGGGSAPQGANDKTSRSRKRAAAAMAQRRSTFTVWTAPPLRRDRLTDDARLNESSSRSSKRDVLLNESFCDALSDAALLNESSSKDICVALRAVNGRRVLV